MEQKIRRDKVLHAPVRAKVTQASNKKSCKNRLTPLLFSDEFQPQLENEGPTRYLRPEANPYELKKLRQGDYVPELFLDLHGLTQMEAKQEIALIAACKRKMSLCLHYATMANIFLKQQTPL